MSEKGTKKKLSFLPDLIRIPLKYAYKSTLFFLRLMAAGSKGVGYLLFGKIHDKYGIKSFYLVRKKNKHFDDTQNKDEYQDEVYKNISQFFINKNLHSILDIGCGSGYKLIKYFGEYNTMGLEVPPSLDFLKQKYPHKKWMLSDLKKPPEETFDIVISIDVIEHLMDPDQLIDFIKKIKCQYIALGTPDRKSKRSIFVQIGPPPNSAHVREWSRKEFVQYVGKYFSIMESNVVSGSEHYVIARKY
jgi:SAM-dependent methyltransferase